MVYSVSECFILIPRQYTSHPNGTSSWVDLKPLRVGRTGNGRISRQKTIFIDTNGNPDGIWF